MSTQIVRLVTRDSDGSIRTRDYESADPILAMHDQIGIDDCSTDLTLRGMPVFRGLIGPIPEGEGIARYETTDVFETLTKEWSMAKVKRRRRRKSTPTSAVPVVEGMDSMSSGFGSMTIT